MARYGEFVHWHEGLFLRPHHLQTLQNRLVEHLRVDRSLNWYYPYGLLEVEVSERSLDNLVVKLERIEAVMPGGVEVSMPGNAEVPPLDLRPLVSEGVTSLMVYLATPQWSATRANLCDEGDDGFQRRSFKARGRRIADENDGGNEQDVSMRRVNARLVAEGENLSDLDVLPIMRIRPLFKEGDSPLVQIDRGFFPPALLVSGCGELVAMTVELLQSLNGYRERLLAALRLSNYSPEVLSGTQAEMILQLRAVNVYAAKLSSLLGTGRCPPFDLYLELRCLVGELAALMPSRDLHDVPDYEHDNCQPVFVEIFSRIRNLICQDSGSYLKIDFAWSEEGKCFAAELTEEHLIKSEDFYLALRCEEGSAALIALVEAGDQFKLTAGSGAAQRVRGVRMKEERYPPPVLPPLRNTLWFKLRRTESQTVWNKIRDERSIALVCPKELFVSSAPSLYATVFASRDGAAPKNKQQGVK